MAQLSDHEGRVRVNGIAHWYRIAGAVHGTTPLLILHGGPGGNSYTFERTIGPRLERFTTVVYYEQRGCGRSDPPPNPGEYSLPLLVADLDALRETLGLRRIVPLGFSFGGELALEYALAHPDRVERLVLQCPSVAAPGRIPFVQTYGLAAVARGEIQRRIRALLAEPGPIERKHERAWQIADTPTVDRLLFHDPRAAALNRRLWRESGLVNTGDMARALARPSPGESAPLIDRIGSVECPALLLVGLHDRNVGVDLVRDVAERLPRAALVVFERSAHFPDIEEPERYATMVEGFLTRQAGK